MAHEAQHRRGTWRLLVKAGIGVRHLCMGGVRAVLSPIVHLGVADLMGCVGHRLGLGLLGGGACRVIHLY